MSKYFIKIVGITSPKNKLLEGINHSIRFIDQTLWPDLQTAQKAVLTNFDSAVNNYKGKCKAELPRGNETSPDTFTYWICDMITVAIYAVKWDYSEPVKTVTGELWDEYTLLENIDIRDYGDGKVYFDFYFSFYEKEYVATISTKDIDKDTHNVGLEGDSLLFDSFEDLLENKYWSKLVERAKQYQEYLNEQEAEMDKPFDWTGLKRVGWKQWFTDESTGKPFEIERSHPEPESYELKNGEYLVPIPGQEN